MRLFIIVMIIGAILYISTFTIANAVDNNCMINILFMFEIQIALGCIEDRLDALENQSTSGETTDCINLANQYQIIVNSTNGDCYVRSLANGTGITIASNSTHLIINSTSGGGETTVCSNIGSFGEGIVSSSSGGNCDFKKLLAGTGISLSSNSTNVIITNTAPDNTVCANVGTGTVIYKDGKCNFKTLVGSADISITNTTNTVVIDYNGTLVSDKQVQQIVSQVYQSVTKTNIGTSYADIYISVFDEENMAERINFSNATYLQVWYLYDYVGVGTHQCRWVDSTNNANVLYEDGTFTTDRDPDEGTLTVIPAWAISGIQRIEMQCKSTTGTDDPIVRGYKIATQ